MHLTVFIVYYLIINILGKYMNLIYVQNGSGPIAGSEKRSCPEMGIKMTENELSYPPNEQIIFFFNFYSQRFKLIYTAK